MDYWIIGFAGGVVTVLVSLGVWKFARRGKGKNNQVADTLTHESFITSMRAMGELNAFRIMTKEVITASDHWLGQFGKKYLNWLLSEQRITLVIEFDVDFKYDLNDPRFKIMKIGEGGFQITMPPCNHEVRIRDMRIHSEDKTELLPWLMPEVIGRVFTGGFSVEAKNKLISETKTQASGFAAGLVTKTTGEAQRSATVTLSMLAQGLGAGRVDFDFMPAGDFHPEVDTSYLENILADPEEFRKEGY